MAQQLQALPDFRSTELVSLLTHSFCPLTHPCVTGMPLLGPWLQGDVTQNTSKREGSEVWINTCLSFPFHREILLPRSRGDSCGGT